MNNNIRAFLAGCALCAGLAVVLSFRSAPAATTYRIITSLEVNTGSDVSRLIMQGSDDTEVSRGLSPLTTGALGKFGKHLSANDRTVESAINELVADGWELVSAVPSAISPSMLSGTGGLTNSAIVTRYLFRRPA